MSNTKPMQFHEAKRFAEKHNFTMRTTRFWTDEVYLYFQVEKNWTFFFLIDDDGEFEPVETDELKEDNPDFFDTELFVPHAPKQ